MCFRRHDRLAAFCWWRRTHSDRCLLGPPEYADKTQNLPGTGEPIPVGGIVACGEAGDCSQCQYSTAARCETLFIALPLSPRGA